MPTKMKKRFLVLLVVVGIMFLFGNNNAVADVICSSATITMVGPVATGGGRNLVILRNDSGAAAGTWTAGEYRQFFLNDTIKTSGLAVALTALSLDKKVWVLIAGSAEMNQDVHIIYLNK